MPEVSRINVEVWRKNFRRRYALNVPGLKALADQIASDAGEMVTITQAGMEGGGGSGMITGNKLEMLSAAEELIAELDPTSANATQPAYSRLMIPDFSLAQP